MNQFDSDQKASKRDPKPAKLVMFRTKTDLWRLVCYFYPFVYNLNKKMLFGKLTLHVLDKIGRKVQSNLFSAPPGEGGFDILPIGPP